MKPLSALNATLEFCGIFQKLKKSLWYIFLSNLKALKILLLTFEITFKLGTLQSDSSHINSMGEISED